MSGMVSAIIPTYNYGRFVGRAVESVLAQTYGRVECIVVNDGSTDDTLSVLARYGDRIRVVDKKNQGLSAARNSGLEAAQGQYVAFLDADDWWEPEKLARQVQVLREIPDLKAVGCGARMISKDLSPLRTRVFGTPSTRRVDNLRGVATRRLWIGGSGSGLLARREIFDCIGPFDVSLKAAEDWDMWLRIAAVFPFTNIHEPLTNIYLHGTGSFRNAAKMEENQWLVYHKAIQRWPDALNAGVQRRMRAVILADAGGEYVSAGNGVMALRRYLAALHAWPFAKDRWFTALRVAVKQCRPSGNVAQGA